MGSVALVPTVLCPKDRLVGDATSPSLNTPDPANQSCTFAFGTLPVKDTFPSVHPVHPSAVGVKVTFNPTLSPAARDAGRFKPDTLNSASPRLMADTVVLAVPVLVRTMT